MEALRTNFLQLSRSPRCNTLKEENDYKNLLLNEGNVRTLLTSSGLDMTTKRVSIPREKKILQEIVDLLFFFFG